MNDGRIHRNMKIARDDRAIAVTDVAITTQHIGKDIRASSKMFTRRAVDVISEACFTGDLRASHVGPQHDRSRSDTVMISSFWCRFLKTITRTTYATSSDQSK